MTWLRLFLSVSFETANEFAAFSTFHRRETFCGPFDFVGAGIQNFYKVYKLSKEILGKAENHAKDENMTTDREQYEFRKQLAIVVGAL